MSQTLLRRTLVFGTAAFIVALAAGSVVSLREVTSTRTEPVSSNVTAGKHVWEQHICQDCHTLLGIGGYWAPELTKEAERRDASYLTSWLKDPPAAKPGTTMPNQHLNDQQVRNVIAFLQWVDKINTNNWPPKPRTAGGAGTAQGPLLFQQLGCVGCHQINGQGARGPGPDLSHIGSTPYDQLSNTPDFLYRWIEDPKAIKPTTIMPSIAMTPDQRLAIVQYLIGLK